MNKKIITVILVGVVVVASVALALTTMTPKPAAPIKPKENLPPVARFDVSAYLIMHNLPVYFNAASSFDPDWDNLTYQWDLGDGSTAIGIAVNHSYKRDNAYNVELSVSDGHLKNSSFATVTVYNVAPRIFGYSPLNSTIIINETDSVEFAANASDSNGDNIEYIWYVDNRTTGNYTNRLNYTADYFSAGLHNITLSADDGIQATTKSWNVTVRNVNRAPTIVQFMPQDEISISETWYVPFSAVANDPDFDELSYTWKLDNKEIFNGSGNSTSFNFTTNYSSAGYHSVSIRFTDGNASVTKSWMMKVNNVNRRPVISDKSLPENITMNETDVLNFTIKASDPDNDSLVYKWYLNNISVNGSSTYRFATSYSSSGNHTIRVEVSDGQEKDCADWNITVLNVNRGPVAIIDTNVFTADIGKPFQFDATRSRDPDGEALNISWDLGDENSSFVWTIAHSYLRSGKYYVSLTVTDTWGAQANATVSVNVTPVFIRQWEKQYINQTPDIFLVEDIDADGARELMMEIYAGTDNNSSAHGYLAIFNLSTMQERWRSEDIGDVTSVTVANIDGDRALELLVGTSIGRSGIIEDMKFSGKALIYDGASHAKQWEESTLGAISSLSTDDMNGDSLKEVIVGFSSGYTINLSNYAVSPNGGLAVYSSSFSLLWKSSGWGASVIIQAGNIDADAAREIVVFTMIGFSQMLNLSNISVFEWAAGEPHETGNFTAINYTSPNIFVVMDINGDSYKEILFGDGVSDSDNSTGFLYALGPDLVPLWKSPDIGKVLSLVVTDIDGVAGPEILVGIEEVNQYYGPHGRMIVYSPGGTELWRTALLGRVDAIAVGDMNSDGVTEIAIGAVTEDSSFGPTNSTIHIYSAATRKELLKLEDAHKLSRQAFLMIDIDGDGSAELLVGEWLTDLLLGVVCIYGY
jgi:PKD repeat protein